MPLEFDYCEVLYDDIDDQYLFVQNAYESDDEFITMERNTEDVLECEEDFVEEKYEEYLERN